MTDRALLVASQTYGLSGCEGDASLMRQVLEGRGVVCTTLTTPEATRAGILAAFDELIAATGKDDGAVFYYSGHGGRMPHPKWRERREAGLSTHLQFIVPSDIDESTEEDFRGLLAEELTDLQRRLTDRTLNVTTILDCCHSAFMARNVLGLVPKATSRSFSAQGAAVRLDSVPPAPHGGGTDTNDIAVRVVACHPEQSAYERDTELFLGRHGVLTEGIAVVLSELADRDVSWAVVADIIRRRAITVAPQQRPEVEGPGERVPFSLRVKTRAYALPVTVEETGVYIEAAPLLGVTRGDTLRLQESGLDEVVGDATVERLDGHRAVLALERAGGGPLPSPLEAVPVRTAVPQHAVRVELTGPSQQALLAAIDASPRLRPAETAEPVLATIGQENGLVVRDSAGAPRHTGALPDDDSGRRRALALVELLAQAERLRALGPGEGPAYLDVPVAVELARHDPEGRRVLDPHGTQLFNGERISVTIRNESNIPVFGWLFDIGVSSRIALVTNESPSGFRLAYAGTPGDSRTVGGTDGLPLDWPPTIPTDGPRLETLVVILADRPQDLHALETGSARERGGASSPLDAILEEVRIGTREWGASQDGAPLRYRVERIDFLLDPRPKPELSEPPFDVDETPHLTLRTVQPRAVEPPPARVAVRLVDLAARRDGALFGAPVRVDTLVLTAGGDGGIVARPGTMRFPAAPDQDVLPLENGRLYQGEVREFLDLALWAGPDDGSGKDLLDLFAHELSRGGAAGALKVVGDLLVAPSATVDPVGAVATAAGLVRTAGQVVGALTHTEAGVYRASRLAFERFGIGRTPRTRRKRAQHIEFAYEIVEV
jgi:hypothetical protein